MTRALGTLALIALQVGTIVGPGQTGRETATRWPGERWEVSTPSAEGLDGEPLEVLAKAIREDRFGYVDRMLVVRHGAVVLDEAFDHNYRAITRGLDYEGHQYAYENPTFHPFHRGTGLHTLQSITKSVTSALVGIALERGEIAGSHVRVLASFPEVPLPDDDERRQVIRLVDLLTMRSGIEWHETDRPIGPTNTTIQLEESDDWIRFTLAQPMDSDPGEKWVYNSGASQLLSGILRRATGRHAHDYAREHLFEPIGIDDFHWKRTPRGYADTEGGLYLRSEDLARFGYLFLRDGEWDGLQVVSREWVRSSTARIVDDVAPGSAADNRGYGYQWWRLDRGETAVWAGLGYGGQYLLVIPEHDLVGVINSWNIFGGRRSVLAPFLDALLAAARGR